jgi:hypothetical protein
MTILERLSDPAGSVVFGWLDANVLYARFERTISEKVGTHFAQRFTSLVGETVAVHYFCDAGEVVSFELGAFDGIVDAMLSKRAQFKLIVVRPWAGALEARAQTLPESIGCFEYVRSGPEFDARLRAAAPLAKVHLFATPLDSSTGARAEPSGPTSPEAGAPLRPGRAMRGAKSSTLTYVFDLSNFEQGHFTAVRFPHLTARPRGSWVCVAGSDEQALALARQAALVEWAEPRTRAPEQFTVHFIDAAVARPCE